MEISHVRDDALSRLEDKQGPTGIAAAILRELSRRRAKDHQVSAWKVGRYYFVGPVPDARTEGLMLRFLERGGAGRLKATA